MYCCAGLAEKLPIERIFREATGHKMSAAIKRILLGKPKAERKAAQMQTAPPTLSEPPVFAKYVQQCAE